LAASSSAATVAPKIVKTTTKQTMVRNAEGVRHNKEEKVEDLTPGGTGAITVVSSVNKVFSQAFCSIRHTLFYMQYIKP